MFSHIMVGANDIEESKVFYDAVLGEIGYGLDVRDPPLRPPVKTHPETGHQSPLIGRHAYGVPELDPDESEKLLQSLLHRGCPWVMTEARVMYHVRIAGDPVSEFAGTN